MMTEALLDVNLLIAGVVENHADHERARGAQAHRRPRGRLDVRGEGRPALRLWLSDAWSLLLLSARTLR